jgi:hypothetical protein
LTTGVEALADELREMPLSDTVGNANKLLIDLQHMVADLRTKEVGDHLAGTLAEAHASANRVRQILEGPEVDSMVKNTSSALSGANKLINNENIDKFLANLPKISEQLTQLIERVDAVAHDPAIDKTLQGTANVGPAVADLRRVLRELHVLLASQRNEIDSVISNLQKVSENAAEVTEDMTANPSRVLFGNPPPKITPKR